MEAARRGDPMSDANIPLGSVSRLLGGLRDGDEEAVRQLWQRYFRPLVRLARSTLSAKGCVLGSVRAGRVRRRRPPAPPAQPDAPVEAAGLLHGPAGVRPGAQGGPAPP